MIDDQNLVMGYPRDTRLLTRDGVSPQEFRSIAKEEIAAYPSVQFTSDTVMEISGQNREFIVKTTEGKQYDAKKILFAVGKKIYL